MYETDLNVLDRASEQGEWEKAAGCLLSGPPKPLVFLGLAADEIPFLVFLANRFLATGKRVAIIDGDLSQPRLGPPATISFLSLGGNVSSLAAEKPTRLAYIGDYGPDDLSFAQKELDRLVRWAQKSLGTEQFLFHLPQWCKPDGKKQVRLPISTSLKGSTIILPRALAERFATGKKFAGLKIFSFDSGGSEETSDSEAVRSHRANVYHRYYKDRRFLMLPFHRIRVEQARFLTGKRIRKVNSEKILYAESLAGEKAKTGVVQAFVSQSLTVQEKLRLKRECHAAARVYEIDPETVKGVQVGLCDVHGRTLDLGIVKQIDFAGHYVEVWTPLPIGKESDVELVRFSRLRIGLDGQELEPLPKGAF